MILLLNVVGATASVVTLSQAVTLDYKNYRFRILNIGITTLMAHITLMMLIGSLQFGLWFVIPFGFMIISLLKFFRTPSVGAIPIGFAMLYLWVNLLTALGSILIKFFAT